MQELPIAAAPLADTHAQEFVAGFGTLSRDMLATVLEQTAECVKVLDIEGRIDFMNRNGRCMMEIDDFSTVAGRPWSSLWPEESRGMIGEVIARAVAGQGSRFEAECPTSKGTLKWWDMTVSPVRDDSGKVFAIVSMSRDMSEQHRAMEALTTMAHEMRHRLRNAYAVSGAISLASGREEPEHAEFTQALAQRLNSLSAVQSSLIDPGEGERLPVLAAQILDAFVNRRGLVATDALPDIALGEQAVRLLALVLGELCTNSLKYGALGRSEPITLTGQGSDDRVTIEWSESLSDADDRPRAAAGEGSGHRLISRMAKIHGGSFEATLGEGRLVARLEMPATR